MSDTDILRRIAERGLHLAQQTDPRFIDLFQHLLDEIPRVAKAHELALQKTQPPENSIMSTNRPLHVPAGYCHHINAQSILNGPWAMCYDCGARHVRAVLEATADGVLVTAGIRSIRRALREQPEIEVAASGFGPLVLRQAADGTLTGLLGGQPVKVHGLE